MVALGLGRPVARPGRYPAGGGRMSESFVQNARALTAAVVGGPGQLDPALRQAAASGAALPDEAATRYVDKVRRHAYRIVDEDIASMHAAGYTDDQVFELTEAAAHGAGLARLEAALAALEGVR